MEERSETERSDSRGGRNPTVRAAALPAAAAGRRTALQAVAALLALLVAAAPAPGQETEEDLAGPAMADAPNQFRVSATAGWLGWDDPDATGEKQVDSGALVGLDLETRVSRWVGFRFGAAYGRTTITEVTNDIGTRESVDANQIVLELVAEPRLAVGTLVRTGVVPFGLVGLGSIVHDPSTEPGAYDPSLPSRSQGSLIYGGGVDVEPEALGSFGFRVEWRRSQVQLQPTFAVTSREGTSRGADRIMASVFWSF